MIHTFIRRWGGCFYSFLALMLCGGYEAGACLSTPDEIKLPGSTFTAEKITVGKWRGRGSAGKATFEIHFGDTLVYHDGRCWYAQSLGACLTQLQNKNNGKNITMSTKTHPNIGIMEWDDRKKILWAYSVLKSADGTVQKDPNKPYLKFYQYKVICNPKFSGDRWCNEQGLRYKSVDLKVTAHAGDRTIGEYSISYNPNGPVARGLGVDHSSQGQGGQQHTGVIQLGNNNNFSSTGCSVTVKRL